MVSMGSIYIIFISGKISIKTENKIYFLMGVIQSETNLF